MAYGINTSRFSIYFSLLNLLQLLSLSSDILIYGSIIIIGRHTQRIWQQNWTIFQEDGG
jgi:competence protein ComGF